MNGFIVAMVLATAPGLAPGQPKWQTDYGKALAAAQRSDKPLLVVLDDPDSATKALPQADETPQRELQALLENYHLCRVDVTTQYGKAVAQQFNAGEYPYTVITNRDASKIILRRVGNFNDGQWTTTLADYRRGSAPATKNVSYAQPTTDGTNRVISRAPATSAPPIRSSSTPALLQSPFSFNPSPADCFT